MVCRLPVILVSLCACLLGTSSTPVAAEVDGAFRGDSRLTQPLTVRVSGMSLDRLLPRISKELGVTLRPGSTAVGDIRVAVFAEGLPADFLSEPNSANPARPCHAG